jgi:hypothetical protein
LKWHSASLWHRPKFLQLLLGYLKNPEMSEHQTANLLEVLEKVPSPTLRDSAAEVLSAFKSLVDTGYYAVDVGIEILTCNGLWDEAVALVEYEEAKLGSSEWDRARKLATPLIRDTLSSVLKDSLRLSRSGSCGRMSRPLKLKVHGAAYQRLSNSPIMGSRAVCGGAPQTFSHPSD